MDNPILEGGILAKDDLTLLFYLVFSPQPPSIPTIRDKDTLSGKNIFSDRIIIFQSDLPRRTRASNVRGKKGMDH